MGINVTNRQRISLETARLHASHTKKIGHIQLLRVIIASVIHRIGFDKHGDVEAMREASEIGSGCIRVVV